MNTAANRNVMPLRLAFGVAAVFLVALAIGYLFIGRERPGMPEFLQKRLEEPAVLPEQERAPAPAVTVHGAADAARETEDAARAQAPAESLPGLEAKKKLASGEPAPGVSPAASPATSTALTDAAMRQERLREADETSTMPLREGEGGVVGAVLGGVEAPPEKDNLAAAKLAAPAPGRDKGSLPQKAEAQLQRFSGSGMAVDALQLFLAATGRAAAPRLLRMEAAPPVRFAGDVEQEDLLDPWAPAGWDWLPAGSELAVTIAADGTVKVVKLLGSWETNAAARAKAAAMKLAFSASGRETRQVVISRDRVN